MSTDVRLRPTPADRKARVAVAALFFTNGALFANLVPRLPQIKAALDLDNSAYGLVVAGFPAGAVAVGLTSAAVIRRFGSAPTAMVSTILAGTAMWAAVMVHSAFALGAMLFLAGAVDAVTDVAQNAHGLRVQRRYGRSIINSFHAVWSVGAVTGGGMAAAAIALELPLGVHIGFAAGLCGLVVLVAFRFRLPGRDGEPEPATSAPGEKRRAVGARTVLILAALVFIAIGDTIVEDAGSSWAALYLSTELGAPAALAATGFIVLVGAQFVGRMLGDRLVDRFGQRAVARAGGILVTVGMGLALAFPTVPGTIAGFAAAGLGVATLFPAAMQEADELPGLRRGTGLTFVSWFPRLGFLLSPPLVGLVADAADLRVGLLAVPLAGVLVIVLSGVLRGR